MEIWKSLKGIVENGDNYEISSHGNIRSIDRISGGKKPRKIKGKTIKKQINTTGYYDVILWKDGKGKHQSIHRLVAKAFIENKQNKKEVNHKDGNKLNNHVSNLEWVTPSENIIHAYKTNLIRYNEDAVKKRAKKCRKKVKMFEYETNKYICTFESITEASNTMKLDKSNLVKVLKGKYKYIDKYYFEYAE